MFTPIQSIAQSNRRNAGYTPAARLLDESPLTPHYLVHLINSPRWHKWIAGFSNGTTINMLPKDALEMPLLVVPPPELGEEFTTLAKSIARRFDATIMQNLKLSALRDQLLPQLLSGKLPVSEFATQLDEQHQIQLASVE